MKAYPSKIIVAWAEAVGGNKAIRDWLISNGYPELGLFVFAVHNKDEARNWLLTNGYPELMALVNAAEGNTQARMWLKKNGYDILEKMALTADNDDEAFAWLMRHQLQDMALVAQRMRVVKNEIERRNNDLHMISPD
jgi:GrpB-like predicted nucleotidyltransferase (UPF0157 family)